MKKNVKFMLGIVTSMVLFLNISLNNNVKGNKAYKVENITVLNISCAEYTCDPKMVQKCTITVGAFTLEGVGIPKKAQ